MEWLRDAFLWVVKNVTGFFWSVVDYVIKMVWDYCFYLYNLFLGEDGLIWYPFNFLLECGNWLLDQMPNFGEVILGYGGTFSFTMAFVGRLNQFFPLTESAVLLGIYIIFMMVFLLFRLLMKVVPGLGG